MTTCVPSSSVPHTVIAYDDRKRNPFWVRRDSAQRKQVMAVEAGVRDLYTYPSLLHVRLGLLPDAQCGEWIVDFCVGGINCKHHRISWFSTVGTVPPVTSAQRPSSSRPSLMG